MKLFHCVVVMGAAMGGGCGGATHPGGSGSKGAPQDAAATDHDDVDGDSAIAFLPPSEDATFTVPACTLITACSATCTGAPNAPQTSQDCPHPEQFQCDGAACGCDPGSPLAPSDCPHTAQFACRSYSPACGCTCRLEAGIDPVACCGDAGFDAAGPCVNSGTFPGLQWTCQSYEPPVGCDCRRLVVPIL